MNPSNDSENYDIPQDTQEMLESLAGAVHDALEYKRRLGQYAVFWHDGRPVAIGDDAPEELRPRDAP